MRAMVGSSILENGFDAGVETAKNSTKGLKTPTLGLLFVGEQSNPEEIIKGIKSVNPNLKVIGCTSSGSVMTPDGIITSPNGYAAMMVLDDNELSVGVAVSQRGTNPRMTGRKLAKAALENAGKKFAPYAFSMFATPGEEEEYLKGIQDIVGEIPMFGGSASDNKLTGNWKVFADDGVTNDGCAVVFYYTNKDIKNVFSGTYKETETMGIITKKDSCRRILEIDNQPALNIYANWIEKNPSDLIGPNLINYSAAHPFGIKTIDGGLMVVRQPLSGTEDGGISLGGNVTDKTAIVLLSNDEDGLIGGAVNMIRELNNEFKPSCFILIHSSERKNMIGERIDEDFVAIKNAAGDTPFIVVFTMAEYGQRDHTGARINNLSLSFTGFSE
ncbi:MAG: FIST C-terminal domain-containing protein [Bacilli bacterium]|nr:FIST C-terminal domain-containing protein [Bacilli bacterium]